MRYTSAEAAKLLRRLQQDKLLIENEERSKMNFHAATTEDPETLRPEYSYEDTQKALDEIDEKIRTVKHAINVFNTVTKVPGFDMTIDQVLVYIPQINNRNKKLFSMGNCLPKQRENALYSQAKNIIDYVYANYDVEKTKKDYKAGQDLVAKIQTALDLVNSTETMEINI